MKCVYFSILVDVVSIFFVLLFGFAVNACIKAYISFCFIRNCCRFTMRNHKVLLDHVGTPHWGFYLTLPKSSRGLLLKFHGSANTESH